MNFIIFPFYFLKNKKILIGCVASALHLEDLSLWHVGPVIVACRPSCPTARGVLVPSPGIEPVSSAL